MSVSDNKMNVELSRLLPILCHIAVAKPTSYFHQTGNAKALDGRKSLKSLRAVLGAFVPGLIIWAIIEATVGQTTDPAPVTIRQFLDQAPRWNETNLLRFQGVVTASLPDKTYFLQDGDAGV